MNVCYVTHLPNLTGANRSLIDMLDGLDRNYVNPIVLLNGHGPIEHELIKRNIHYRITLYSPATNSDNKLKNVVKKIANSALVNKLAVNNIKKIFKEEEIDLVHNNSYLVGAGMEAAYKLNIPYVCHIREFVWEDHHRRFFHADKQLKLLKNASTVVAITQSVKKKFQNKISQNIIVETDGFNINEYDIKNKTVLNSTTINILMAGRITPGKGQLNAIKAIEMVTNEMPNYRIGLTIIGGVGDIPYFQKIQEYVKLHKLCNIKILDFTENLRSIRKKSDIGLTCSISEALGRVTIENMLSSLLVIGYGSAGSEELIKDGQTGLLYKKNEPSALAEIIIQAIHNNHKSSIIAQNGYQFAKSNFSNMQYGKKIMSIYQEIL